MDRMSDAKSAEKIKHYVEKKRNTYRGMRGGGCRESARHAHPKIERPIERTRRGVCRQ